MTHAGALDRACFSSLSPMCKLVRESQDLDEHVQEAAIKLKLRTETSFTSQNLLFCPKAELATLRLVAADVALDPLTHKACTNLSISMP